MPRLALAFSLAAALLTGCLGPGTTKPTRLFVMNSLRPHNTGRPQSPRFARIAFVCGTIRALLQYPSAVPQT